MAMAATKILANMYKKLQIEPVEGFTVELADDDNLFEWKIWIEGPKDTLYEGGIFEMRMKFPTDFPMSPPDLRFVSEFWHPNVYSDTGAVCISILHPPGVDELSGELPEERWLPTQSVATVLLSVISLLGSPNFSSPANVDANVEWRKNPESFKKRIQRLIEKANKEKPTHIVIPHPDTNPSEHEKQVQKMRELQRSMENLEDEMLYDDTLPEEEDEEPSGSREEEEEEEDSASKEATVSKSKPKQNDSFSKPITKEGKSPKSTKDSKSDKNDHKHKKKDSADESEDSLSTTTTITKQKKKKKCIIM